MFNIFEAGVLETAALVVVIVVVGAAVVEVVVVGTAGHVTLVILQWQFNASANSMQVADVMRVQ